MASRSSCQFGSVPGFAIQAVHAGMKGSGKLDLGLITAAEAVPAAGVFTTNRVAAAPVRLSRQHLRSSRGRARAVLVNAGNANACTGRQGLADARACARAVVAHVGGAAREVLVCSTGVIGKRLNMSRMLAGIERVHAARGRTGADAFARAILTTDLVPKTAGVRVRSLGGGRIVGACKGSGMIAPNMATMLGFVLTDVRATPGVLQVALRRATESTFNCVTVDGDTSTNDTVLLLASGRVGGRAVQRTSGRLFGRFADGLQEVCRSLARQIAADGEGATKCVRVRVAGARSHRAARQAARTVAESPLVKTALFGNDPNWGRILAALGRSDAGVCEARTSVRLCGVTLFKAGGPCAFRASAVSRKMRAKEIVLDIRLGRGPGRCEILSCDLSYAYVRINAEYHT